MAPSRRSPRYGQYHSRRLRPAVQGVLLATAVVTALSLLSCVFGGGLCLLGKGQPGHRAEEPSNYSAKLEDYQLTRELLQKHSVDGVVVWTIANLKYVEYALNWAHHVEKAGVKPYLVGALDDEALVKIASKGVPCFAMGSALPAEELTWGSKHFKRRGAEKIKVLVIILSFGFTSFFTDVDTVWLRNPLPYFRRFPDADALCSGDTRTTDNPQDNDSLLEPGPKFGGMGGMGYVNTGVLYHKPSTIKFAQEWHDELVKAPPNQMEQPTYNIVMFRHGVRPAPNRTDRMHLAYNATLLLGFLPLRYFTHGRMFFVERHAAEPPGPYIMHANYLSGFELKRHLFREHKLWSQDPPDYFMPPGGLMTYEPDIPAQMLRAAVPLGCWNGVCTNASALLTPADVKGHFDLINHQLVQLRTAFAISQALGRALILPNIWCGVDHGIEAHPGIWGPVGVRMASMPFKCPLSFVLKMEDLLRAGMDPPFTIRESGFLQNQRLPGEVAISHVWVDICKHKDQHLCCGVGRRCASVSGNIRLQPNLTDVQLQAAIEGLYKGGPVHVLHFTSLTHAFGGHEDAAIAQRFEDNTRHTTASWCCLVPDKTKKIGQRVRLDMWWDRIPHIDAAGVTWTTPWVPWP